MSEEQRGEIENNSNANVAYEVHLLDLFIALARHKKLVIFTPIVTGALALVVSLYMTPIFSSTAKIMPPQQQQSTGVTAMLGQLGGLAGAAGGIAGLKNPNDLYVGLLESRTISDSLITRLKLKDYYQRKTMDETRQVLANNVDIESGKKDGLISIKVTDEQPQFAADLANAYVDELAKLTETLAISEASQRRLFFEKQLEETKKQLEDAEVALKATQEKTGIILPDGQIQAIIGGIAQLKGMVAAKEVQLNSMRTFAASQNPDLLRTQEELRGMQAQLAKLEKDRPSSKGDFMVPLGKIPEAGVEYVRSLRNVKYYETIFEMLAKQYELAKIDEAKQSSLIQLLDKAVPAERKSKPRRAFITLAGIFGGFVLGVSIAFACALYDASRKNPANSARWNKLSMALRGHEK